MTSVFIYGVELTTISFKEIDFLLVGCLFMKEQELIFQSYRPTSRIQSDVNEKTDVKKENCLGLKRPGILNLTLRRALGLD